VSSFLTAHQHKIGHFSAKLYAGKPHASRIGLHNMTKITRELSKLALRHCKQHTDTICAKNAAESLACNDYRKFCNTVHKQNNSRVTRFAQTVDETDECMGDEQIAERWRQHFQVLCNSIADNKSKIDLQSRLSTRLACANDIMIALSDVCYTYKKLCYRRQQRDPTCQSKSCQSLLHK